MEKNIFQQIIDKEIDGYILYEDEYVMAILDINPVVKAHTLVIPKKFSENLLDADDLTLEKMITATKKVAKAILAAYPEYKGFNLQLNNGRIAGQIISHLHWHIIPRKEDDGLKLWDSMGPIDSVIAESVLRNVKMKI